MWRSPSTRRIRIRPRLDRPHTVETVRRRREQRDTDEVRIQWSRILVDWIAVATSGIGLPKLDCHPQYRRSVDPQHAPGEFDDLAGGSPGSVRDMSEIEL